MKACETFIGELCKFVGLVLGSCLLILPWLSQITHPFSPHVLIHWPRKGRTQVGEPNVDASLQSNNPSSAGMMKLALRDVLTVVVTVSVFERSIKSLIKVQRSLRLEVGLAGWQPWSK